MLEQKNMVQIHGIVAGYLTLPFLLPSLSTKAYHAFTFTIMKTII